MRMAWLNGSGLQNGFYAACTVVLTCMTQRMAGLHALQQTLGIPAATAVQSSDTAAEAQPTPCELSAKSLLAAPP